MKTTPANKKAKLALARETVVELRSQVLAAIHGGADNTAHCTNNSCTMWACCISWNGKG